MTNESILQSVRDCKNFALTRDTFNRMTGLDLWLDSVESDDPHTREALASDYYQTLITDAELKERCESSHQTMRNEVHDKKVTYSNGISGLTHILVPIHHNGDTIGFFRCGGMRDSYRGVLRFMNFSEELREEGYDEAFLKDLEAAFRKLPNLHGDDLAEAVEWLLERAREIELSMNTLDTMLK